MNKVSRTDNLKLEYLDKISSDLCGPISPVTYDNKRYIVTFLDRKTRFLEIKLLKIKEETIEAFKRFRERVKTQENKRVKIFSTDNGTEFVNKSFQSLFEKDGTIYQINVAYIKEPTGFIERINRTLLVKIRALITTVNLPYFI